MLKLKFQYLGHLMQKANSQEKTMMLEKIESKRRRGWWMMRWLSDITGSVDMSLGKLWEIVKDRKSQSWTPLSNRRRRTTNDHKELDTTDFHFQTELEGRRLILYISLTQQRNPGLCTHGSWEKITKVKYHQTSSDLSIIYHSYYFSSHQSALTC